MAPKQNLAAFPTGQSSSNYNAPPAGFLPGSAGRRDFVIRSVMHSYNEQPLAPPPGLRVKNTFLHVEEGENTVRRSRSDSDLSSSSSSQQDFAPPLPLNHHGFDLAPGPAGSDPTPRAASSAYSSAYSTAPRFAPLPPPATPPPPRPKAVPVPPTPFDTPAHGGLAEQDKEDQWEQDNGGQWEQDKEEQWDEDPEERWSVGSALHSTGGCKPCAYKASKDGCFNGRSCNFCHMYHQRRVRPRPCKAKREQCKQIVAMLDSAHSGNTQDLAKDLYRRSAESGVSPSEQAYLMTVLAGKARLQEGRHEQSQSSDSSANQREVNRQSARMCKMTL